MWKYEDINRVGPLQDALVTPGARGQSELQGENAGVEGGQVVPLLPARHHLQHRPGKHLDSEFFPTKMFTCRSILDGGLGPCCY